MKRATLLGFFFGCLFPLFGTFLQCLQVGMLTVGGAVTVQATTPLLWIIDTAPIVLAGMGYLVVYINPAHHNSVQSTGRGLPSIFVCLGVIPVLLFSIALYFNRNAVRTMADSNRCNDIAISVMQMMQSGERTSPALREIDSLDVRRGPLRGRYPELFAPTDTVWKQLRSEITSHAQPSTRTILSLVLAYQHAAQVITERHQQIVAQANGTFITGLLLSLSLLPFGMGLIRRVYLTERSLREERDFVAAILDTAGAIIVTHDPNGTVRSFNRAGEQLTGYAAPEIIGNHLSEQLGPDCEGNLERCEGDWIDRQGNRHRIAWSNSRLLNPDGTLRLTIRSGIDVTEQRLIEESLRQSDARLHEAQRIAQIGSWEYDIETGKMTWSPEMFRVLAFDPTEAEPKYQRLLDRFHPDDREIPSTVIDQALVDGVPYSFEVRVLFDDGRVTWVRAHGQGIKDEQGRVIHLIGTLQDVTEYRQIQDQLRTTALELSETADRLQRTNGALREFTAVASHDLRAPLRHIRHVVTDLCRKSAGDEERLASLRRIERSCQRMQNLIDNLLELARVTARGEAAVRRPVNLEEIMEDVKMDQTVRLRETQGNILSQSLPRFYGDPAQIYQLLSNLVGNALKYHQKDTPPTVRVEGVVTVPPGYVGFSVSDNGIGFSPEDSERIFKPFERLGQQDKEGAGIGLAICQRIVENHGGCIKVSSTPGEGSTFTIALPIGASPTTEIIPTPTT